jgi:hypothetical protein
MNESIQPAKASNICLFCNGDGFYFYDENHVKPCEHCCLHEKGWWELSNSYYEYIKDADNACCKNGCGMLRRNINSTNFK